jgi:hypothetical protein
LLLGFSLGLTIMAQSLALATLATLAGACDEQHDPGCVATVEPLRKSLSCPWKVTSGDITVNNPVIRQANPGRDCDYLNNAALHMDTCEQCGKAHVPCNNTFMACAGCCQPDSTIALREHDCDDVKDYFRWQNECPLKLMTADLEEEPDTSAILQPVIVEHSPAKVLAEGNLTTSCSVTVQNFKCPKIPAIVEFDCMQCNIGSADLMAKCCNECVRFSTSETLANVTMIEPFVVCKGCQTQTINIPWKGKVIQQPWVHAGKYDDYSRQSQEDRMDKWVDKKICSKLAKDTCENPPRKSGRRLREAMSTTTTTTREVLAEQCRRLAASSSTTAATSIAIASTVAGASTTAGADKSEKGANHTALGDEGPSSGSATLTVPMGLIAVIVGSVVLV